MPADAQPAPFPGDRVPAGGSDGAGPPQGLFWSWELDFDVLQAALNSPAPWNRPRPAASAAAADSASRAADGNPADSAGAADSGSRAAEGSPAAGTRPAASSSNASISNEDGSSSSNGGGSAGSDAAGSDAAGGPAADGGAAAGGGDAAAAEQEQQRQEQEEEEEDQQALLAEMMAAGMGPALPAGVVVGRVAECLPPGPALAGWLASAPVQELEDGALPGVASSWRKLACWAQARELEAVAEIASRTAARDPKIGVDEGGQPRRLPVSACAEVSLELVLSHGTACWWTDLGISLRWRLPATGAALRDGVIDLMRARLITEAVSVLAPGAARAVERRILPKAANLTYGQLRAALRRAVISADPAGAERRRQEAERRARVVLYPEAEGTASVAGQGLPGVHAAAVMARIKAMARALKAAGAAGPMDLLCARIFVGLLLGTLPLIPPAPGAPPDIPPPDDHGPDPGPDDRGPDPGIGDRGPGNGSQGSHGPDDRPDDRSPHHRSPHHRSPHHRSPHHRSPHHRSPDNRPDDDRPDNGGPDARKGRGSAGGGPGHGHDPGSGSGTPDRGPAARRHGRADPQDGAPAASPAPAPPAPAPTAPPAPAPPAPPAPAPAPPVPPAPAPPAPAPPAPAPPAPAPAPSGPAGAWQDVPFPGDQDAPADDSDPGPDPDPAPTWHHDDDDDQPTGPPAWPPLPALPPALTRPPARPAAAHRPPAGLLDLALPWTTLAGHSAEPGHLGRIGPITAPQARLLAQAAAADPGTQWRIIVTTPAGHAIAVTRIPRPPAPRTPAPRRTSQDTPRQDGPGHHGRDGPPPGTGLVGRITLTISQDTLASTPGPDPPPGHDPPGPDPPPGHDPPGPDPPPGHGPPGHGPPGHHDRPGPDPPAGITAAALRAARRAADRARQHATADTTAAGGCGHLDHSPAYRPPPRLQEYVTARDLTCRSPICRQPAWRGDLDHTMPWPQGPTCRCNLGGFCRTHHLLKHLPGWHVTQAGTPGTFTWTTPAGRTYTTTPDIHPI